MSSTTNVAKKFDLHGQYHVFQPWLEENGFSLEDLPLTAKTEDGETVIVEAYYNEEKELIWKISTCQDNGWIRVNHYHPDGTVEESFEK